MMSPAYAITATERILPSVVFDFTSAGQLGFDYSLI
jgi:hypothetical protein